MATNEPGVQVIATQAFSQALKALRKRYRRITDDLRPLIEDLETGNLPGDRLEGLDSYIVYKVRLPNRDAGRGKSGGYRVIYYVRRSDTIFLITIYSKTDQQNVQNAMLRMLIRQAELDS